jgi:hypothetical protein
MRRATAAAGGRHTCRTNATHPGGSKENNDHASARAGVRAAATPALAQPWRRVTSFNSAAGWRLSTYGVRLLQRTKFPVAVVETYTLAPRQHPYGQPVSRRGMALEASS